MNEAIQPLSPTAFLSCSLRNEDGGFVNFIARVAHACGFVPCGTVGKYAASPIPLWQHMLDGIKTTDCLIVAATPRYIQQDVADKQKTKTGIPEMLHVESAMAFAQGKPVLVFVQPGTDVGPFLPLVTEYITVDERNRPDVEKKWPLIVNYFESARRIVEERRKNENTRQLVNLTVGGLAFFGAIAIIDYVLGEDQKPKRRGASSRRFR